MPFLDNPTTEMQYFDAYGRPINVNSLVTRQQLSTFRSSPTESYNEVLPLDVVSQNQPGISHDSYLPDPRIPSIKHTSTGESHNNNKDDVSNMLYGMSFHHDEHEYQHQDDIAENNRRGPQ